MAQEEVDNVKHKRTVIEERGVLVQEPESHYVGHFKPASGSAAAITFSCCNNIFSFFWKLTVLAQTILWLWTVMIQLVTLVKILKLFMWLK